jgi:quercetin dioxygenase-like cupin family protein
MTVRRVVTGAAEAGPARFVGDGPVEPVRFSSSGHSYSQLWGADEPGGYRFGIFVVAAAVNADADPGMHATDSIDLVLVLEGSVEVELDSGETRILTTGDTLVQNGSAHRWVNKGDIEARLAVFTVGACRDEAAGA